MTGTRVFVNVGVGVGVNVGVAVRVRVKVGLGELVSLKRGVIVRVGRGVEVGGLVRVADAVAVDFKMDQLPDKNCPSPARKAIPKIVPAIPSIRRLSIFGAVIFHRINLGSGLKSESLCITGAKYF